MTGWEWLAVQLVLMIVSTAISMSMAPDAPTNPNAEAGKLETPTAEEGSPIPVIFGTVIVKRSNVVWYGDSLVTDIVVDSGSGGKK